MFILFSVQEHDSNAYIDLLFALGRHFIQTGAKKGEGRWRRRIFDCSGVVTIAKKYEKKKGKKKNRKRYKGNEE